MDDPERDGGELTEGKSAASRSGESPLLDAPEDSRLRATLESMLFAAGEPVSLGRLAAVLDDVPKERIIKALSELRLSYSNEVRGIGLEQVAGGYQLRTSREFAPYVRKLLEARPPRLTRPMLETLAIVAYRQPITRPEIEELRGVDCAAVLDTLLERRLARITGRRDAPGRPMLYGTTSEFLETFGLKSLDGLPDLNELREIDGSLDPGAPMNPQIETPLEIPEIANEADGESVAGIAAETAAEAIGPTQKQDSSDLASPDEEAEKPRT